MAGIPADQLRQILVAARSGGRRTEPYSSGDGAKWLGWRQNFTITAAINGWDNRRQRLEIVVAMTGAAKQYVADSPVGDGLPAGLAAGAAIPDAQDATLLLNLYEQRFLPAAASDIARVTFCQASQKEDEPILAWSSRLRLLHSRAYPNMPAADKETNTDLIEAFVVRLNNKVTTDRVWNRRPDTYAQALQFANDAHAGQKILNQAVPPQPKEEPGLFFVGQGEPEDGGAAAIGAARRRAAASGAINPATRSATVTSCGTCSMGARGAAAEPEAEAAAGEEAEEELGAARPAAVEGEEPKAAEAEAAKRTSATASSALSRPSSTRTWVTGSGRTPTETRRKGPRKTSKGSLRGRPSTRIAQPNLVHPATSPSSPITAATPL